MEMLNRAIDGAALFKDLMHKVAATAAPATPVDPAVAAWNAEVDRKKAETLARKMNAHYAALRTELAKATNGLR